MSEDKKPSRRELRRAERDKKRAERSSRPIVLKRSDLEKRRACDLKRFFDESPREKDGVITYPNGLTDAEVKRLATTKPRALLWLASQPRCQPRSWLGH